MRTSPLFFFLVLACGGATEPAPATGGATPTPAPTEGGGAAGGDASEVELHEWALVDVLEGGATELAGGPGHPLPTMSVRKPVLYAHLPEGTESATFTVEARMTSGSILEHWPLGAVSGGTVRWDVVAARAHCPTDAPGTRGPVPADGVSELPDLPSYDATDAACLTVGSTHLGLLFYRGSMPVPALPLTVVRGTSGDVTVTASGTTTGAPGEVLRISTGLSGPWPVGHVVVSRAPMPASGTSVTLPVGTIAVDPMAEGEHLAEATLALGMTRPEADAFVTAWREALFGAGESSRELRDARMAVRPPPLPQDAVIYWLPTAAVDTIATTTVTPAATVRRAFLVRVNLPAVATAELGTPRETYASR